MTDVVNTADKAAQLHVEDLDEKREVADGPSHVEGNALLIGADGTIRKLPVPSSDPNDPLNFSSWQKLGILVACCWFCKYFAPSIPVSSILSDDCNSASMSLTLVGGLGPILGVFFGMYAPQGKSPNQIVWLSTMPSLFVGVGK